MKPQTVEWLKRAARVVPPAQAAAAFVHIPLPEFVRAWNRGGHVVGQKGELTCCPSCNSGTLAALRYVDCLWKGGTTGAEIASRSSTCRFCIQSCPIALQHLNGAVQCSARSTHALGD